MSARRRTTAIDRAIDTAVAVGLFMASSACTPSTPPSAAPKPQPSPTAKAEAFTQRATTTAAANQMALQAAVSLKGADGGVVEVVVTATSPYHVNTEYPHRLVLEGEGAETLTEAAFVGAGAFTVDSETSGRWRRPLTWPASGGFVVTGRFFTSVCSDEKCIIEKVPLRLTVPAS